jgi:hypothetical protein
LDSSSSTDSDSESEQTEEKSKNDFHIDKRRLKAVQTYEEKNSRITFDPDGDNFNFGYEMALTLKVRLNLIKMVRKEILA